MLNFYFVLTRTLQNCHANLCRMTKIPEKKVVNER